MVSELRTAGGKTVAHTSLTLMREMARQPGPTLPFSWEQRPCTNWCGSTKMRRVALCTAATGSGTATTFVGSFTPGRYLPSGHARRPTRTVAEGHQPIAQVFTDCDRSGTHLTFSCDVLMMLDSLRPFTTSSYTHMFTVALKRGSRAAFQPTMRAMALPLCASRGGERVCRTERSDASSTRRQCVCVCVSVRDGARSGSGITSCQSPGCRPSRGDRPGCR